MQLVREVPKEVMFKVSDAIQDQTKKNRYWFEFPAQWSNQLDKDPIIGIRSLYETKTNRLVNFDFTVDLIENEAVLVSRTYNLIFWLDGADNISVIGQKFDKYWFTSSMNESKSVWAGTIDHEFVANDFVCFSVYDPDEHSLRLVFTCSDTCPITITVTDTRPDHSSHTCNIRLSVQAVNEDTVGLFGTENKFWGIREVSKPIWSRYQMYVLSSLAEDDANGFLGHTRTAPYYPIKYYRLKNKNKRFWIELYETRFHDVPVELPSDKRDDVFIEAIVCFSSSGML